MVDRRVLFLPPAMIGHDDPIDAGLQGLRGILRGHYALDQEFDRHQFSDVRSR